MVKNEKRNLKTFRIQGKSIKTEISEILLSPFLITARNRPELDLEESIENNEFAAVPKSISTSDGQLLHSFDKAKILHAIEAMVKDEETNADETNLDVSARVMIIDGMALVNSVHKEKKNENLEENFD